MQPLRSPFRGASRGDLLPCGSARRASFCSTVGIGSVFDVGRRAATQTVGDGGREKVGERQGTEHCLMFRCFETRGQNDGSGGSGILFRRRWTAANLAGAGLLPEAASAPKNHGSALTQPQRGRLQADRAAAGLPIAARQTCGTRNWPPQPCSRSLQWSQRSQAVSRCLFVSGLWPPFGPGARRARRLLLFQVAVQQTTAASSGSNARWP
jgi:hypothetical protein